MERSKREADCNRWANPRKHFGYVVRKKFWISSQVKIVFNNVKRAKLSVEPNSPIIGAADCDGRIWPHRQVGLF